jgi:hypothetical protein
MGAESMKHGVKSERAIRFKSQQRRQRQITRLVWSVAGLLAVIIVGFLVWTATRPQTNQEVGAAVAVSSRDHIPVGTVPGPYNSDPPAGGNHYDQTLPAKFYQEADLASLPQHPEGYLVHDLEHGYVIFWYNCQPLSDADCTSMKTDIQMIMNEFNNLKVVAFPWKSLDVPLVMTSWGRMLRFKSADLRLMRSFVEVNRYKSPEPDAP